MTVLVDTQVWLWMLADPERLRAESRSLLESRDTEILLSAASTWEIAIKWAIGKLGLPGNPEQVIGEMMSQTRVTPLPILHSHTLHVATLPRHHRDPFDRLLVAQAQFTDIPLMTADPKITLYDVQVIEA